MSESRALTRLANELKMLNSEPPLHFTAGPIGGDMFQWEAKIKGPADSPYAGGVFVVNIHFPNDYPLKPPKLSFKTRIYHPNISREGCICFNLLNEGWSPAFTIPKVLLLIYSLLFDPKPENPSEADIASIYISDRANYEETARTWTQDFAMS